MANGQPTFKQRVAMAMIAAEQKDLYKKSKPSSQSGDDFNTQCIEPFERILRSIGIEKIPQVRVAQAPDMLNPLYSSVLGYPDKNAIVVVMPDFAKRFEAQPELGIQALVEQFCVMHADAFRPSGEAIPNKEVAINAMCAAAVISNNYDAARELARQMHSYESLRISQAKDRLNALDEKSTSHERARAGFHHGFMSRKVSEHMGSLHERLLALGDAPRIDMPEAIARLVASHNERWGMLNDSGLHEGSYGRRAGFVR